MPLHEDDPEREGNLTDEEYEAITKERIAKLGNKGLHIIPPALLEAALEAVKAQAEGD